MENLGKLNIVLGIFILILSVVIWNTASTLACIAFSVVLLVAVLNITGILGSIFNKKVVVNDITNSPDYSKKSVITVYGEDKLPSEGLVLTPTKSVSSNEI